MIDPAPMSCPSCETPALAAARYCANCGHALGEPTEAVHEMGITAEADAVRAALGRNAGDAA